MNRKSLFVGIFLISVVSSSAMAASGGYRDNQQNDCGIWLCLPFGFPQSCESQASTYVKRLTELTGGKHPTRKWTSLPNYNLCGDQEDRQIGDTTVKAAQMTYWERQDAHIPTHDECQAFQPVYKQLPNGDNELVGYTCTFWKHVDELYVENNRCWFDWEDPGYSNIEMYEYGTHKQMRSNNKPAWCDYTVTSTKVYQDGEPVGDQPDYTYRQKHY